MRGLFLSFFRVYLFFSIFHLFYLFSVISPFILHAHPCILLIRSAGLPLLAHDDDVDSLTGRARAGKDLRKDRAELIVEVKLLSMGNEWSLPYLFVRVLRLVFPAFACFLFLLHSHPRFLTCYFMSDDEAVLSSGDILIYEAFVAPSFLSPSQFSDDRLPVRFKRVAHGILFHHIREYAS